MSVEREAKLLADESFVPPSLDDCGTVVPLDTRRLDATYYDTEDLRLTRWGVSLRYRKGEGVGRLGVWTVKLPEQPDGGVMVRAEHAFDGGPRSVPSGARSLVAAYARTAPLVPVARLATLRRRLELRDDAGVPLVEIDDDAVSVYEGRSVSRRFREIEIEIHDGASKELTNRVVDRFRQQGASAADARSKVARALDVADTDGELFISDLPKRATVADVVANAIASGVHRLLLHDPGVRLGDDPEDVHQARVGFRRLRSDLRTFRRYLEAEEVDPLRDALRALADALGRVRDADVLYERLAEQARRLPQRDARATATLLRKISAERSAARDALLAELDGDGYVELLERLVALALDPPVTKRARKDVAREVLPAVVAKPWRQLQRAVDDLGPAPAVDQLHSVRIRAKRVRYAAEAVAPAVGKEATRFAKAIADLQGELGDLQDAVVAEAWLRDKGLTASPPAALVAGELVSIERDLIERGLRNWSGAWKKASRKNLREWLR